MSANKDSLKSIAYFIIKISALAYGHYYFSKRILAAVNINNMQSAASYSVLFAGVVLLLLIMFRWSGFFSRLIAAGIGICVFASILVMHALGEQEMNTVFGLIYVSITVVTVALTYFILFRDHSN